MRSLAPIAFGDMTSSNYRMTTSTMSGGGAPMTFGSYDMNGTLGQSSPLIDTSNPPATTTILGSGTP